MSKISYAAMSLIGAVPGGYLSYLLVMAMLNNFSKMPGMMRIVVCAILALSALVTVIPLGILIFVKSEKEEAEEAAKESKSLAAADDVEEMEEVSDVPDLDAAGVTDADESVMIEHEEEGLDDIYEADDEIEEKPKKGKKRK